MKASENNRRWTQMYADNFGFDSGFSGLRLLIFRIAVTSFVNRLSIF
ncbi:MAG: hypothetical protein JOZ31_26530 [Verrucomicrobia bacterium]|nr:hypothetical protein [Verrucomicrobiota bacterium]MBV8485453.1 hypothetical protein [Verrucomicrobiota bacterium]